MPRILNPGRLQEACGVPFLENPAPYCEEKLWVVLEGRYEERASLLPVFWHLITHPILMDPNVFHDCKHPACTAEAAHQGHHRILQRRLAQEDPHQVTLVAMQMWTCVCIIIICMLSTSQARPLPTGN